MPRKVPFIHKFLKRLDRLDRESIQKYFLALAEERSVYEEILQELNEGVLILNAKGQVRFLNRQAAIWLDLQPEAVQHKMIRVAIKDSELATFIETRLAGLKEKVIGEISLLTPRELRLRVFLTPLENSQEKDILVLLMNLSSEKKSGSEKDKMIEPLIRLASGVAHEIGNPLNSIGIHLQLLRKNLKALPEAKRPVFEKTIQVLHAETERLDKIVRNFLKATRRPPLRFETENPNEILDEAIGFMRLELEKSGVSIQFRRDPELPAFLIDRERLYQAFINLIKNAKEAMPDGGVLRTSLAHQDKVALLIFKDEGKGIPEKDLPHIFEAYYTTKDEGSGLGLMTVFNAVRDHGGRIEVASRPHHGTTFTLLLPIRQPKLQLPQY